MLSQESRYKLEFILPLFQCKIVVFERFSELGNHVDLGILRQLTRLPVGPVRHIENFMMNQCFTAVKNKHEFIDTVIENFIHCSDNGSLLSSASCYCLLVPIVAYCLLLLLSGLC